MHPLHKYGKHIHDIYSAEGIKGRPTCCFYFLQSRYRLLVIKEADIEKPFRNYTRLQILVLKYKIMQTPKQKFVAMLWFIHVIDKFDLKINI